MSASYDENTPHAFIVGYVDPYLEAEIFHMFDNSVELDILEFERDSIELKTYRKIALSSLLLYPIQYIVCKIFSDKDQLKFLRAHNSLYWKLIRKKVTIKQFREELIKIARNWNV